MTMSMVNSHSQDTIGDDEVRVLRARIAEDGPRLPLAGPAVDEAAARQAARKAVADLVDERVMDQVLEQI
jgi:putative transposase